jgi:hypothetical protein
MAHAKRALGVPGISTASLRVSSNPKGLNRVYQEIFERNSSTAIPLLYFH